MSLPTAPAPRPASRVPSVRLGAAWPTGSRLRPLASSSVTLHTGLLRHWQERNRQSTIPHSVRELLAAGNLDNLRRLIEDTGLDYQGRYPFLDTDIYKTLEGLAYEIGRGELAPDDVRFFEEAVDLIERAQQPDGYLNSYFQAEVNGKQPWQDLSWGHELYNLGHLIQAAVATHRQTGDDRLLTVARKFADLAVRKFGPRKEEQGQEEQGQEEAACGHPEVEMALVELFRETGNREYLELAEAFIDRRGHSNRKHTIFPPEYFQDHLPLREMPSVTGHAVRMTYLAAGAADVMLETGDSTLADALTRLWDDMVSTKLYITGGLGSRHSDEAIGDRYELPSERSYSETCAAIATMQWAWRMFLATGTTGYLDVTETVLYNAFAVGLATDGAGFFYDNPLQRRPDHEQRSGAETGGSPLRRAWFGCPCCPPNIIRWMAQLQDYLVAENDHALYLGHFAGMLVDGAQVDLRVQTDYPYDGRIKIEILRAPTGPYELAVRIPAWCHSHHLTVNGDELASVSTDGWLRLKQSWKVGDVVELELAMPVRAHAAHPYLDATRATLALARGPLVFCAEQQDNATPVDDLIISPDALGSATVETLNLVSTAGTTTTDQTTMITIDALAAAPPPRILYPEIGEALSPQLTVPTTATLVPYFLWGNREPQAMRVWLRHPLRATRGPIT